MASLASGMPTEFLRAQLQRQLTSGAVIKLNEQMDDGVRQEKRFVVLEVNHLTTCFVINSEVNSFIQNRAPLLRAQVLMTVAAHPFMSWDSHVNCSELKHYPTAAVLDELVANPSWMLGRIVLPTRDEIVQELQLSSTISPKASRPLCLALQAMI